MMSPVSAACAAQLTSEEADLVIIDFAINDLNREQDGVPFRRSTGRAVVTIDAPTHSENTGVTPALF